MKMTFSMSVVATCAIKDCAYNVDETCNARAITIGDGVHPGCDTFFSNATHTNEVNELTGVGACKIRSCRHNSDFECGADHVDVGHNKSGICCLTYELS